MDTAKIKIDADQDHILFTVGLYKLFLALGKEGMDALAVYIHLFFTARIQATNTVWANNSYLQKGTACGEAKIKKAKTLLRSLGLIEYIRDKPKKGTPILGKVYIKLNIIPNKETMEKILSSTGSISTIVDDNTSCSEVIKYLNIKSKVLVNTSVSESKDSSTTNNDSKSKKIKTLKIDTDSKNIIDKWNSIKLVSKHNTEKSSKTLESAIKYINLLKAGKFIEYLSITDSQLEKLNIPLKCKSKKFTQEEIITGLNNYALQFEKGYWPITEEEKLRLPRSLSSCFYNKFNQSCVSPFLKVFFNKPKKVEEKEFNLPEIRDPGYNILHGALKSMQGDTLNNRTIYKNTNLIREWIAEIRDDFKYLTKTGNDDFYSRFTKDTTNINLFRDLEDFLQQRKEAGIIADQNMVKPGTKTWKSFEAYLFKNFGVDVNNPPSKPKEKKKIVHISELQYPWEEDKLPNGHTWFYRSLSTADKQRCKDFIAESKYTNQEELDSVLDEFAKPFLYTKEQIEQSEKRANRIRKTLGIAEVV